MSRPASQEAIDMAVYRLNAAGVRIACLKCWPHLAVQKMPYVVLLPMKRDTPLVRRALHDLGMGQMPVVRPKLNKIIKTSRHHFEEAKGEG